MSEDNKKSILDGTMLDGKLVEDGLVSAWNWAGGLFNRGVDKAKDLGSDALSTVTDTVTDTVKDAVGLGDDTGAPDSGSGGSNLLAIIASIFSSIGTGWAGKKVGLGFWPRTIMAIAVPFLIFNLLKGKPKEDFTQAASTAPKTELVVDNQNETPKAFNEISTDQSVEIPIQSKLTSNEFKKIQRENAQIIDVDQGVNPELVYEG